MKLIRITAIICVALFAASCNTLPLDVNLITDGRLVTINDISTPIPQTAAANSIIKFLSDESFSGDKKVLFLGYDGVRVDCLPSAKTPAIDRVATAGGLYLAYAGGEKGTATEQKTYSGPGWTTLLTGVWADRHEFISNDTKVKSTSAPSIFKQAAAMTPAYKSASIINWGPINSAILSDEAGTLAYEFDGGSDLEVKEKAIELISGVNDIDVFFVDFDDPDHAGHSTGYSPLNTTYIDQLTTTDAMGDEIIDAVQARTTYNSENWLIVISTDHGGLGTGHGGQTEAERIIFLAINKRTALPAFK